MKKVLALALALAMLIPMSLVKPVKADAVEKEPFYDLGWSDFDEEKYPYLDGLVTSNMTNLGENAVHSYGGAKMQFGTYTDADVTKLAEAIKKEMNSRPEGMRYWTVFGPMKIMALAPQNALFMDHGVDQMAQMMEDLLKKYKEIGGLMDGMVVDIEYIGLGCYYLIDAVTDNQTNNFTKNPKLLKQIVADPRYKTEIRPLLEDYGFIFYQAENAAQQAERTELYSLVKSAGAKYEKSRLIWDVVMRIHLNRYVDEWLYTPMQKYFPDASLSDYQSIDSASWLKMAAVTDDGITLSGGNSVKSGDTSSYSYYYARPSSDFYKNNQKYSGFNDAIFKAEPFSNLLYDINFTRHMYESSDTKQIAPWITYHTYGGKTAQTMASTPYYSELLYHLGMFDPEPFLSYTYVGDSCFKDGKSQSAHYLEVQQVQNEIMAELTRVAGYADRKHIPMPQNWNSKFVLTGMYSNGRNIWRITPNTNVITRGDFKVSDSDPTFFVNGETVTFPGGKILDETEISVVGSCGYWVETDANVMPVITAEETRYENYPSLVYDFEEYDYGAFDYNTSKPLNAWGFSWGKTASGIQGSSTIVTIDGNKKLALIGNSRNWIKDLAGNITAGDTYAEDQAWSIAITVPEGLSKDAEIMVLNYAGSKQKFTDGGFKIQDNKLYYSVGKVDDEGNPIYEQLMEIDAGSTYILTRFMDFNDKEAFSCDFVVANKNGRELKRVENVPAPGFNYITQLSFGVSNADKAIQVDDFKIYLTGTALDFSIYDAKTGRDLELYSANNRSTAYRLSWLNATMEEETAYIKADITENGKTTTKVVKEIKMLPGTDGIDTGIVEIKEGQSVEVYLESTVAYAVNPEATAPSVKSELTPLGTKEIPEALKQAGMDTVDKIKEALTQAVHGVNNTVPLENMLYYDLSVNRADIPKNGVMSVVLPYPAGTDSNYTFFVSHMYSTNSFGKTPGEVEVLEVTNTDEGIKVVITGTSPILLGWIAPEIVEDTTDELITRAPTTMTRPVGVRITKATEAVEEDYYEDEPTEEEYFEEEPTEEVEESVETTAPEVEEEGSGILLVLIIAAAVVILAGAGVAVFFLLKKKPAVPAAAPAEQTFEAPEEPEAPTEE